MISPMNNAHAGLSRVPLDECKSRALAFGRQQPPGQFLPASEFASVIWPGHRMQPQGAGAAATRVLKALEKEGRAGWHPGYDRGQSRTRWGWWAR